MTQLQHMFSRQITTVRLIAIDVRDVECDIRAWNTDHDDAAAGNLKLLGEMRGGHMKKDEAKRTFIRRWYGNRVDVVVDKPSRQCEIGGFNMVKQERHGSIKVGLVGFADRNNSPGIDHGRSDHRLPSRR